MSGNGLPDCQIFNIVESKGHLCDEDKERSQKLGAATADDNNYTNITSVEKSPRMVRSPSEKLQTTVSPAFPLSRDRLKRHCIARPVSSHKGVFTDGTADDAADNTTSALIDRLRCTCHLNPFGGVAISTMVLIGAWKRPSRPDRLAAPGRITRLFLLFVTDDNLTMNRSRV